MIEILKLSLNYGVALFFAVLFYMDFRKKIASLDKTITNDLFHIIQEDSKNTKAVTEAIKELTSEIRGMKR